MTVRDSLTTSLHRHVQTGRGVAPHWDSERVWWAVIGLLSVRLDVRCWRFGVALAPRALILTFNLGPLAVSVGQTRFRWRTRPTTTGSLGGVSFQDYACSFTFTTGTVDGDRG